MSIYLSNALSFILSFVYGCTYSSDLYSIDVLQILDFHMILIDYD